ncbi:MAG: hypothetical protein L3J41_07310 [Melioribacteraceae bacterium]|nr:hypothetical protein [Melioribacteraceae bacterium]
MVPIVLKREDCNNKELTIEEFRKDFINICRSHHSDKRALVFAFLLYDFDNAYISQIIKNPEYWNALDYLSGKYLSIFYIHTKDKNLFDKYESPKVLYNMLSVLGNKSPYEESRTILENHFGIKSRIKLPSVLFFQVRENSLSDYFIVELKASSLETLFNELIDTVRETVTTLQKVEKENYNNLNEVFELIRTSIRNKHQLELITKVIKKIPVVNLLSFILPE